MPQLSPPGVAVQVRQARPSDRRAVRAVLLAAYREYAAVLPPAVFGPYLADILDLDAREGVGRLLAAERAGRVVGAVTWYADAAAEGLGWPPGWAGPARPRGRPGGPRPRRRPGAGRGLRAAGPGRRGARAVPAHRRVQDRRGGPVRVAGVPRDPSFDFEAASQLRVGGIQPVRILAYRLDRP